MKTFEVYTSNSVETERIKADHYIVDGKDVTFYRDGKAVEVIRSFYVFREVPEELSPPA